METIIVCIHRIKSGYLVSFYCPNLAMDYLGHLKASVVVSSDDAQETLRKLPVEINNSIGELGTHVY